MKIGLIDLDTSHPGSWIPILRELGHEIIGVYDAGRVHPPEYAREFARQHGLHRVFNTLSDLAECVDLGIVHGCDWDEHVASARPLVEQGKAVLIDKPLAGKLADLATMIAWADAGVRITGGSALRLCAQAVAHVNQHGRATTAVTSCGLGAFDYGIHAYALLMAIMHGHDGPTAVRHLGDGHDGRVLIDWPDGRAGIVVTGNEKTWMPFHATVLDEKSASQFTADIGLLYRTFLGGVLPYLAGETDQPPVAMRDLVIAERCAIAALVSQRQGGARIELDTFNDDEGGYDGAAFAGRYRSLKYPTDRGAPTRPARCATSPASARTS